MAHLAKILMSRGETCAAKVRASDCVARKPAAMSAEMMPAAKMCAAKSVSPAMPTAVPAAMATAVTPSVAAASVAAASVAAASVAAASGDCVARQRQHDGKNRNSHHTQ
jgi:hypothetical protein